MGKAEKVHFSVAIVLCDMEIQSSSTPTNSRGQGLCRRHPLSTFSKDFSSEITGLIEAKFHIEP